MAMMIMIKPEHFQWVAVSQFHPLCSVAKELISLVNPL